LAKTKYIIPWEAEGFWLWWARTSPPDIRVRPYILQIDAPPAGHTSARSKRKRKKPPPKSVNWLYED
jgi:hypothetical protein